MNSLTGIGVAFVEKHGAAKAAEVIGKGVQIPEKWPQGNQPTVIDLEKLVAFDPELLGVSAAVPGETPLPSTPLMAPYEWPKGTRIAILMPTNRAPHVGLLKCFSAIFERDKMQFIPLKTNMPPSRGRNILAQRWMESGCPLALWLDDDVLFPHGDVQWYREQCGNPNFPAEYALINPIARLMQQNRTLIGGCYFGRSDGGRAQYANAFMSNQADDAAHNGPRNFVEETPWVGFGFTLVNVSVLHDIIRTQPEVEIKNAALAKQLGYRYRFFNALSVDGEDSENSEDNCFCTRALQAGHRTFVDHAVVPIHVGERGYSYHNTRRARPQLF